MQTSIVNSIIDDVYAYLQQQMSVGISDESRVILVFVGPLREDPTDTAINLIIREADTDWKDTLNIEGETYNEIIYETGGGSMWRRRFTLQLKLFFNESYDQEEARRTGNVIRSRAEYLLMQMSRLSGLLNSGPDSFGESASHLEVVDSYLRQGGGPDAWKGTGEIRFEAITEKG